MFKNVYKFSTNTSHFYQLKMKTIKKFLTAKFILTARFRMAATICACDKLEA